MIHDLENSAAFKAIREIQNISTFLAIKELEKLPSIKAFSRVADQLKHEYGALALSEAYDLLLDEITEVKNDDNWESFSEKVKDRASRTPETRLSAEFYLALIFSFILYLLSQKSAIESETRISERINDLEQTITTQFDILQSNNANYVFSVTDRELNLRAGPSVDHKVIEVLPKNKKVVELERNRDWVKIEFFDYLANLSRVGWVHSRYLLIVDSKSEE
ncbi:MAG: SH3 domain-containing protein [Gammaproteobacteria bacterium]|nr:SH3 domain-containing protein [Gammaproteobacteria bacterium]